MAANSPSPAPAAHAFSAASLTVEATTFLVLLLGLV